MVSRHFCRLAEHRLKSADDGKADRHKLESFLSSEGQRRDRLASKQPRSAGELERLTDLLQFCDLLSLYICCGARENVVLPEYFGVQVRVTSRPEGLKLDPPVVSGNARFSVAALRYPPFKGSSSQEILLNIL